MEKMNKQHRRDVHGILLLDKPAGATSNQVLQHVKRLYRAHKAGHTGSLDKLASGLLPLCLGEATKLSGYLLDADKVYEATCALGVTTTTGDAAGEVIDSKPVPDISRQELEKVLERFRGEIQQTPPMFSALKHEGRRLYKLAYAGITVEREPRTVTIYELTHGRCSGDELKIRVCCSKGTYIRTLAEDIGRELGCGAHLKMLRRIGAGPFTASQMVTMTEIDHLAQIGPDALDKQLVPMDYVLRNVPAVHLNESMAFYMRQGQAITVPRAPVQGLVRLYDQRDMFLGVGTILDDGRVGPKRLVQAIHST
jgi:tRNA pseudouridine55 synthase